MMEKKYGRKFWLCLLIIFIIDLLPSGVYAATYVQSWDLVDSGKHLDVDGNSKYMSYVWKGKKIWNGYKKGVIRKDSAFVLQDLYCSDMKSPQNVYAITTIHGKMIFNKSMMDISTTKGKTNVALHELGHALGLSHNRTFGNVMYHDKTGQIVLSKEDKASYDKAAKKY